MSAAEIIGVVLIAFAIGIMLGHAAGYARRGDVERKRQIAAMNGGPRYARTTDVGAAE